MPQSLPPLGVALTTTGAQTPVTSGPGAVRIMILATFPSGPNFPLDTQPQQLAALYGDPSSALSIGYTGPYLAYAASQQVSPAGGGPVTYLICRAGVTPGTYVARDSASAICFTLTAIGIYAGSASAYLQPTIAVAGGRVTALYFTDSRTAQQVGPVFADLTIGGNNDLSSNANIVAAINASNPNTALNSNVHATLGASTLVPTAVTAGTFGTGTDGYGTAYNDATIGTAGSGGLLDQSLYLPVDFIVAGYDARQIGPTLMAHIASARAQNDFRKAILGPVAGTSYAALSSGTYLGGSLSSSRLTVLGHDSLPAIHPATGVTHNFDGHTVAAAHAALMASGPTAETSINYPIAGFLSVGTPPDLTGAPSMAQTQALTNQGLTTLTQTYGNPAVVINDSVTTAPQYINGASQVNQFAYQNIVNIDDAVSRATIAALQQFRGRPMTAALEGQMVLSVTNGINALGTATNGVNTVTFTQDPNTLAFTGVVSYATRSGVRTINVSSGFTNTAPPTASSASGG